MRIHIVRHAKTEPYSQSGQDVDRKLLKRGIEQSKVLAQFLKDKTIKPELIFCSDAVRTRETVKILRKNELLDDIIYTHQLYLCSKEDLLKLVCKQTNKGEIMIIGHNNGLSDFASYLLDDYIELKTCEYISLELPIESWEEASGGIATVADRFRPEVS